MLFGVKDSAKGVGNTVCLVLVTRPFHLTDGVGNTTTGYSPVTIRMMNERVRSVMIFLTVVYGFVLRTVSVHSSSSALCTISTC